MFLSVWCPVWSFGSLFCLFVCFLSSLHILYISPLLDVELVKTIPILWAALYSIDGVLWRVSHLIRYHLLTVGLSGFTIGVLFRNLSPVPMSSRLFLTLFLIRFRESGLMLRFCGG